MWDATPTTSAVTTRDGLSIDVHEWGRSDARAIVFVHGGFQSHLSWRRQCASELADRFRLIAYDLRGHGGSSKPIEAGFYDDGRRWAEELRAVMTHAVAEPPVVVGWSYGCRVISDFLNYFGDSEIAGVNYVGGIPKTTVNAPAEEVKRALGQIRRTELLVRIEGIRAFSRAFFCSYSPTIEELEVMAAVAAMVPVQICEPMLSRPADYGATMAQITKPVLLTHGVEDRVASIECAEFAATQIPHARKSFYRNVGHAPFWEAARRFNSELAEFADAAM